MEQTVMRLESLLHIVLTQRVGPVLKQKRPT